MRYTLKRATNADRAFAERLHEECYRDVVRCQFGAWDSAVQSRFFEQKWQPEHYCIIMFEEEAIGVLALHDGSRSFAPFGDSDLSVVPRQRYRFSDSGRSDRARTEAEEFCPVAGVALQSGTSTL